VTSPPPPQGAQQYPEQSQAVLALVLSILHFVVCPVLAPVAWWMGQTELTAIADGRRDPVNQGTANAAKIVGIIGTVLLGIGILAVIAIVLFGVIAGVSTSIG